MPNQVTDSNSSNQYDFEPASRRTHAGGSKTTIRTASRSFDTKAERTARKSAILARMPLEAGRSQLRDLGALSPDELAGRCRQTVQVHRHENGEGLGCLGFARPSNLILVGNSPSPGHAFAIPFHW